MGGLDVSCVLYFDLDTFADLGLQETFRKTVLGFVGDILISVDVICELCGLEDLEGLLGAGDYDCVSISIVLHYV